MMRRLGREVVSAHRGLRGHGEEPGFEQEM